MGVKRYFMNEKEADTIRKSLYESLLMDENDKIVHWDFDPHAAIRISLLYG